MARSLVRYVTAEAQIAGNGIFIFPQPPTPRLVPGGGIGVGIVIASEWGPSGAANAWDFTNPPALLDRFWPMGPDAAYWAVAAYPWLKPARFIRVVGTGATAATRTFNDDDDPTPAASLVATARQAGAAGNRIYVTATANASVSTSRDLRVRVLYDGATVMHDVTYPAVQVANGNVTDPGDPYVAFTKAVSADEQCAVFAETALATGTSGTVAAADVRTALDAFGGASVDVDVVAVAGLLDGIADDVNEQMDQWAAAATGSGRIACLMTPSDDDDEDMIAAVEDYRNERCRIDWPRLTRSLIYSYNGLALDAEQTTCPSLARACAYQHVDSHQAIFLAGFPIAVAASITGLADETADLDDLADLKAAGVNTWVRDENAWVPYCDVSTLLVNTVPVAGNRIRYQDYLMDAISRFQQRFLGLKLDINLATGQLGPNTGLQAAQIQGFLRGEEVAGVLTAGLNDDDTPSPAYSFDGLTLMTPTKFNAGRWDVQIDARMTPTFQQGVLYPNIGFDLNIRAAA